MSKDDVYIPQMEGEHSWAKERGCSKTFGVNPVGILLNNVERWQNNYKPIPISYHPFEVDAVKAGIIESGNKDIKTMGGMSSCFTCPGTDRYFIDKVVSKMNLKTHEALQHLWMVLVNALGGSENDSKTPWTFHVQETIPDNSIVVNMDDEQANILGLG